MNWSKKWPTTEGMYWFYGYRYGRISCGTICKPETCLVKVIRISNGLMFTTDSQGMFESEVEDAHFQKAILPKPPQLAEVREDL